MSTMFPQSTFKYIHSCVAEAAPNNKSPAPVRGGLPAQPCHHKSYVTPVLYFAVEADELVVIKKWL